MILQQLRLPHPLAQELVHDRAATHSAYASLHKSTVQALGALDATWKTINNYTVQVPPLNVATNLAAGSIDPSTVGVFLLSVALSFTCTALNAGRNTNVRLYNLTTAQPSATFYPIFVGRDTEGASSTAISLFLLADTSDNMVVQIGGGDTFANVNVTNVSYSLSKVSP